MTYKSLIIVWVHPHLPCLLNQHRIAAVAVSHSIKRMCCSRWFSVVLINKRLLGNSAHSYRIISAHYRQGRYIVQHLLHSHGCISLSLLTSYYPAACPRYEDPLSSLVWHDKDLKSPSPACVNAWKERLFILRCKNSSVSPFKLCFTSNFHKTW